MKIKYNSAKLLVNALFLLIALLLGAIGLRMGVDESLATKFLQTGAVFGFLSALIFVVGIIYPLIIKAKKSNPTKIRQRLTDSFNVAEEKQDKFLFKMKLKNLNFAIYFFIVSFVGVVFFIFVSLCLFVKPLVYLCLPLVFIAVIPLRKWVEYLLKKDVSSFSEGGITKEDFPVVYNFFADLVQKELGDYKLVLDFGSTHSLDASLVAKTVVLNLNSYAFMLFNEHELKALVVRELRALKDRQCKFVVSILKSRNFYLSSTSKGLFFSGYFSFVLADTVTDFDFSKNALKRILERRKDELIKGSDYAEDYLRAYKKQGVLDGYFSDARSFITLKICKEEGSVREFVSSVYNIFLRLVPIYGEEWEQDVEKKLKAIVCSSLTYSEKCKNIGLTVDCGEFKNNCTDEQSSVYEKYNTIYYESTKHAHAPKKRAIEDFYRDIEHYEVNPQEYDERLKLIGVAHAYYMTAQLDKAEEVYNKIIESGDTTSETCFDFGCFLLLAKRDRRGVEYVYKAMENENIVEEGFEVLGKYFILSGDKEGYKEFCDYKAKRLDEIVNGLKNRVLDKNAKFVKTSLEESVLNEMVEKLSKDDNLAEIYCADSKTKSGQKIIVFAVSVRNKTQEALYESYERVFSILDNDYGKYDTFLIAIDAEPDKKIVKRITKEGVYQIYKK